MWQRRPRKLARPIRDGFPPFNQRHPLSDAKFGAIRIGIGRNVEEQLLRFLRGLGF